MRKILELLRLARSLNLTQIVARSQFLRPKRKVPWKSIAFAVGLFVMGTVLLVCGCLIHIGHVDSDKYGDRLWPLTIFGLLMFIPGKSGFFTLNTNTLTALCP